MKRFMGCLLTCVWAGLTLADETRAELVCALEPLSVRGVNYFPRETPWGGMWTQTPAKVWKKDLALAWCLHDYPIKNPNESHFGLARPDDSLKPAGAVLRDTFARWTHP